MKYVVLILAIALAVYEVVSLIIGIKNKKKHNNNDLSSSNEVDKNN